jgi:hypothetical protein
MAGSERTETGTPSSSSGTPSPAAFAAPAASTEARSQSPTEGSRPGPASGAMAAVNGFRVDCLMNARYHAAREAFLDGVHRWLMLGVILFGSAAMLDVFGAEFPNSALIKAVLAALPVVLGALDLTFDLSNRARTHAFMKHRYFELLADVVSDEKTTEEADAAMHRCSADEEPAYHALIATAWNAAQAMVYGDRAKHYELSRLSRFFKQVFRFEGSHFPVIEGPSS